MKEKDKELLLEAIDNYSAYTSNQRKLLKIFINIAMENIVKANIPELSKLSSVSRPTIYRYIDFFKREGIIDILNDTATTLNSFRLNINKLDDIIEYHLKKENILRK